MKKKLLFVCNFNFELRCQTFIPSQCANFARENCHCHLRSYRGVTSLRCFEVNYCNTFYSDFILILIASLLFCAQNKFVCVHAIVKCNAKLLSDIKSDMSGR